MELWKDILGYEGYYQASSYGRIRSVPRIVTQKGHKNNYTRVFKEKVLCQRKQNANYYIVWLSKNGEINAQLVHRLVAKTFISNISNKPCVNHKDGIKTNNQIANLEWCNHSENVKHAHKIIGRAKISKPIICVELNLEFESQIQASEKLGINRHSICNVLNGRSKTAGGFIWKFV